MLRITVICVGKLREKFFKDAVGEYSKRLGAYCRLQVIELPEQLLPRNPTATQIEQALRREGTFIASKIPKGAVTAALCIEGDSITSEGLARVLTSRAVPSISHLAFIVGGSHGLHDSVKKSCDMRLSMSPMTFPHHLARVMLLEQLYRAFKIGEGSRYHK